MSVYDMIYSYTYVYIDVYINRLYSINDKYESSFFYRLIFSYSIIYLPHHTCMNIHLFLLIALKLLVVGGGWCARVAGGHSLRYYTINTVKKE